MVDDKPYWVGSDGSLRPEEAVSNADKRKEKIFDDLFERAKELQVQMKQFKDDAMTTIDEYVASSAKRAKVEGWKGNIRLNDYDGSRRVEVANRARVDFNENLQFAKAKFDEWVLEVTQDGNADLADFIQKAFEVDKQGKVNRSFLFKLLSQQVSHPTFKKAQELLKKSVMVIETKKYLLFQEKDDDGELQTIVLDFASL